MGSGQAQIEALWDSLLIHCDACTALEVLFRSTKSHFLSILPRFVHSVVCDAVSRVGDLAWCK